MQKVKYFFLLLLIISSCNVFAQTVCVPKKKPAFIVEAKLHYGFIISHSPSMRYLVPHHFDMYDITVNFPSSGKNDAELAYNYPMFGLTYLYSNFNNKQFLGGVHALEAHYTFPLIRRKTFLFSYRIGPGIGYIEKPFDRINNFKDVAIGSHINMSVMMMFEARKQISEKTTLTGGIAFTHFSNGAYKIPNLGINIPTLHVGIGYRIGEEEQKICRDSLKKHVKRNKFFVLANYSEKQIYPVGSGSFGVGNFALCASPITGHKSIWGAMLEYTYNSALVDEYKQKQQPLKNNLQISRLGLFASYEQRAHKASILVGMGYYLVSKWKGDGMIYHKIGLRYYCDNGFILNWSLKTHWAVADYFEFGIGYTLNRKNKS